MSQTRRGGPGGQHRNKTSTTIVLEHRASGIVAEASERRSQVDNRRVALRRLREQLAIELRTDKDAKVDVYTVDHDDEVEPIDWLAMVTEIRDACSGRNLRISENNPQRPQVLAVLLDDLWNNQGTLQPVAQLWKTSSSQIVKLLKDVPEAFKKVNGWRATAGLGPLK